MRLPWDEIQSNATAFSKRWRDAKNEEAQAQSFMTDFLRVFGVDDPESIGNFEYKVSLSGGSSGYTDYVWKSKIAIEMKSRGKNLDEAYRQLQNYMKNLSAEEVPDLWLVSDFENMQVYRRSINRIFSFKTKDLRKNIRLFADIAGYETERVIESQVAVNRKAAEKMAHLHNGLKSFGYEGHNLELYLVRLLFCMFSDDSDIFKKDSFHNYIEQSKKDGSDLSFRLFNLFDILNTDEEARKKRPHLAEIYNQYRYINGALFEEPLPPAEFDSKMRTTLLDCINFDWSEINPAIFGAMFQGVMDEKQRREMGAHYTSEENILKLINPLFMDELWEEFDRVKTNEKALDIFHMKIAGLKFLDPACGCGNFLIITYRELRMLELEILRMKHSSQQLLIEFTNLLKVNVEQFYGIEYENFPCQIAQVGMWLIDHQMNMKVSDEFGLYHARLPLTQSATIIHGNALRMAWEDVVPKSELSYILGNPPFIGARMMNEQQKADITEIVETEALFAPRYKNMADNLDYVAAWYFKAAQYIQATRIPIGFVSTNSISQGEQVAPLWDTLINDYAVEINFAYRTFKWGNEAKGRAAVHCVIVGYSRVGTKIGNKRIFDGDNQISASNISPYLVDAPSIIVKPHKKPLCYVPEMKFGSQPRDGGHFVLTPEERAEILQKEPSLDTVIKPYIGAEEFLQDKERYCIWLLNAPFEIVGSSKILRERIAAVEEFRLSSRAKTTNQYAKVPSIFAQIAQPDGEYLLVPRVSSENRRYIPIGFIDANTIASDAVQIVPDASLYHFGILTSNVHMAWMRAVAGRLKSDYRYSKELVYNTFPWPDANDKQKRDIEILARAVFNERTKHKGSSLAKLYDPINMKITGLQKVHQSLDAAVQRLYGFPVKADFTETLCVAALMGMYLELVNRKGGVG